MVGSLVDTLWMLDETADEARDGDDRSDFEAKMKIILTLSQMSTGFPQPQPLLRDLSLSSLNEPNGLGKEAARRKKQEEEWPGSQRQRKRRPFPGFLRVQKHWVQRFQVHIARW